MVYYQIDYTLDELPEEITYFHAQFRRTNPLPYKGVYTILDGIKAAFPDAEVTYERGCDLVEGFISVPKAPRTGMDMAELARQMGLKAIPSENYTDEALKALADRAAQADVIVFAGGISPAVEGEELKTTVDGFAGGDRQRIELPEVQKGLIRAMHGVIFLKARKRFFKASGILFPDCPFHEICNTVADERANFLFRTVRQPTFLQSKVDGIG